MGRGSAAPDLSGLALDEDPLDETLRTAHERGEVVLYTPPREPGHPHARPHYIEIGPDPRVP